MEVYTDITQVPLDPYTTPDVGDSQPQQNPGDAKSRLQTAGISIIEASTSAVFVIPFTRTLSLGSHGQDVKGAKRAIWRGNGLGVPKDPTPTFGPIAVKQLKVFQQHHGLAPDGQLGPATLKVLAPFFDQYAFLLYVGYPPGSSKADIIVAYAWWGYNNRANIFYAEYRPMDHLNDLYYLPDTEDCSSFATKSYKRGGANDPNGMNYDGYGNTSSMRAHGRVVSIEEAKPGDLPQYLSPDHVAIYIGSERGISHGSNDGPSLSSIYYRPLYQIRAYLH
jgi:peptidoglycan hydrolase-like protein with peptidoglycan-binding domain